MGLTDIALMPFHEFKKLEKDVGKNPYKNPALAKEVLERSIFLQSRDLADNFFYYFLKKHRHTQYADVILVDYYKNRNGIKNILPVSRQQVEKFALNFKPQRKVFYFKVLGKHHPIGNTLYTKINNLLREFGSDKRMVLWHNKYLIKSLSSEMLLGICREKEAYGTKIYDFTTEDVRSPFSLTESMGLANYFFVMLRRESTKMVHEQMVLNFVGGKASEAEKALFNVYLISSPSGATKSRMETMMEETFENVLYHELGHMSVFRQFKARDLMKMPYYAKEVMANIIDESKHGIGLLPRIIKISREDELKAIRLWSLHYWRNLALFSGNRLVEEAVIELALMSDSLVNGNINFGRLESIIADAKERITKDPAAVLKDSYKKLQIFSQPPF